MSSINGKPDLSEKLDIAEIRSKLAGSKGPAYWRGLEEIAQTDRFQRFLRHEFPTYATVWESTTNRRQFLTLMGASLAAAGLAGCAPTIPEKIVPYVQPPEESIPGKPLYFATAMPVNGLATGLLVESHSGRPTKVEGNPDHPASLGATDIFAQASVLGLCDPDRSQAPIASGELSTWERFVSQIGMALETARLNQGASLRILTGTVTSPTLGAQIKDLLKNYPLAKWCQYEPMGRDTVREGTRIAFGSVVDAIYDLERADVILSLDADFLGLMPGNLRYTRQFADRRRQSAGDVKPNRLYMAEASPTTTGTMAEHRWPLRQSEIGKLAWSLAEAFSIDSGHATPSRFAAPWLAALVDDLRNHKGRSLVIAGEQQPATVHAIVHALNAALGNVGVTVSYVEPVEFEPSLEIESIKSLAADVKSGRVDVLLMLGGNPVFDAPADLDFRKLVESVATTVHVSLYRNDTSVLSRWHLPEAHFLEAWGDARAFDGTVTIMQPLINPLYGGRSFHEILAIFSGNPGRSGYDIVREYWRARHGEADFERWWQHSVHDGVVPGTPSASRAVSVLPAFARSFTPPAEPAGLEVVFRPDPTILDGRFANNGWLQELPKPLTRLTWDNAALVAPSTAERLSLQNEEVVTLTVAGKSVDVPIWIVPGHAVDSITLHYGYGAVRMGNVALGCGSNIYPLRTAGAMNSQTDVALVRTGKTRGLACTQIHHNMEGRNPIRAGTIEEFQRNEEFVKEMGEEPAATLSMYPPRTELNGEYAWGMSIDLGVCTGCNACVVACQSENNIPVVGRAEVANGREMHWIRIDRYYNGDLDNPEILTQPIPCMHCENAPCELVCPVGATVHSDEGLNDMVYNRCVGTRYCANNCPYKVRRFNFLQYSDYDTPVLDLMRNPDVTVRSRGVMEKCTYCVQRINQTKIQAEKENRSVRDGEIQTACQQVCPAEAIIFGNIHDSNSHVSRLKSSPLSYGLLGELNTRPRTTYLARISNPNPEIKK